MGVKDISAYEDNGYAVFTVSVANNVDNAYLCITAPASNWCFSAFRPDGANNWPITRETHADYKWGFQTVAINGVKLKDYVDTSKAMPQVVAVPLSKLVNDPDFQEFGGKTIEGITEYYEKDDFKFDLSLFSGMGVAKQESGGTEQMQVRVTALEIVAVETPVNLVATKNDKSVTLTWDETSDLDVTYKLYRDGELIATTAGTSYVDADLEGGTYTYAVEAYDLTYKVPSPKSAIATVEIEGAPVVPIVITEVDMEGNGRAWDIVINVFEAAKTYFAKFTDGSDVKQGEISGLSDIEVEGSVAFAVFLNTSRASKIQLDIVAE